MKKLNIFKKEVNIQSTLLIYRLRALLKSDELILINTPLGALVETQGDKLMMVITGTKKYTVLKKENPLLMEAWKEFLMIADTYKDKSIKELSEGEL